MKYLSQKKGFLGFDANQVDDYKVTVVPFGLEETVSYGGGTKNGPKEIIKLLIKLSYLTKNWIKSHIKKLELKPLNPLLWKKKLNLL